MSQPAIVTKETKTVTRPMSTLLMGAPGVGKTIMACETAVNQPVHVIDLDRKIGSNGRLRARIEQGLLTYREVAETVTEDAMQARIMQLAKQTKTQIQPKGWAEFFEAVYTMKTDVRAQRAGTWVIDSMTVAAEHGKALIAHYAGVPKFQFDQWTALLGSMRDTIQTIRDLAREFNKDLIITVHEKLRDIPGARVTGVNQLVNKASDGRVSTLKQYEGTLDPKFLPTIDGSFASEMGAYFDEVYHLRVDVDNNGKPRWVCRVHPDGRRDLRTSFSVDKSEFNPDFRLIWK